MGEYMLKYYPSLSHVRIYIKKKSRWWNRLCYVLPFPLAFSSFCLLICLFIEVVYRFWFANFFLSRSATQSLSTPAFSFFSSYFWHVTFLDTVRFTFSRRLVSGLFSRPLSRSGLITLTSPVPTPVFPRDLRPKHISSKRQSSPAPSHFASIDRSCPNWWNPDLPSAYIYDLRNRVRSSAHIALRWSFASPLTPRELETYRNDKLRREGIIRRRESARVNYFPTKLLLSEITLVHIRNIIKKRKSFDNKKFASNVPIDIFQ